MIAENTGISRVKVEPTHSGIRTSDQFIKTWPMIPDPIAIAASSAQFFHEGHDMSWPNMNPSGVTMIAVHSAVPAVNSVGVTLPFDCFDAMKYALHENIAPTASRSPFDVAHVVGGRAGDDHEDAGERNERPDRVTAPDLLAEELGGDDPDEDGLQRADDRGVDDARVLDRREEQGDVGAERDPAERRRPHAVQREWRSRGTASR